MGQFRKTTEKWSCWFGIECCVCEIGSLFTLWSREFLYKLGWGYWVNSPPPRYFPIFHNYQNNVTGYHTHIGQVSGSNRYSCQMRYTLRYVEIWERSFSNPATYRLIWQNHWIIPEIWIETGLTWQHHRVWDRINIEPHSFFNMTSLQAVEKGHRTMAIETDTSQPPRRHLVGVDYSSKIVRLETILVMLGYHALWQQLSILHNMKNTAEIHPYQSTERCRQAWCLLSSTRADRRCVCQMHESTSY